MSMYTTKSKSNLSFDNTTNDKIIEKKNYTQNSVN